MKPIILVDVDGCIVKWQSGLPYFNSDHNLPMTAAIKMQYNEDFISPEEIFGLNTEIANKLMHKYNTSKYIRYLAGYPDAVEMINKHKEQFDFIAVTALSSDETATLNRLYNLNSLFPGAFIDVLSCDFRESKTEKLRQIKARFGDRRIECFIDDLGNNIRDAYKVFGEDINYFHIIRGDRTKCSLATPCKDIKEVFECICS